MTHELFEAIAFKLTYDENKFFSRESFAHVCLCPENENVQNYKVCLPWRMEFKFCLKNLCLFKNNYYEKYDTSSNLLRHKAIKYFKTTEKK